MMRLFVAIWPPAEVLDDLPLAYLQSRIDRQGVRFTRPEKIHLTLRFLGNVQDEQLEPLVQALSESLAAVSSVELEAKGVGGFPNLRRPKIVWIGLSADLMAIRDRVVEATDSFAEVLDDDSSQPHLTIARVSPASQKVGRILADCLQELGDRNFARWRASEVTLVKTLPNGSYEVVARFPLSD
jgi:2'-5' RNA ligase